MKSELSVVDVGEFGLIARLAKLLPAVPGVVGVGDDTAVLPLGLLKSGFGGIINTETEGWLLVTVDSMVEERHFRRRYGDPYSVGWKLLASSLSDVAAMGGEPRVAVVNLALPGDCPVPWVEDCYRGIAALAAQTGVGIVGGDTVAAREISLSLTLIGFTRQQPRLRSAAVVGQDVWVSGQIGDAGAGLRLFENSAATAADERYREKFLRPKPQIQLGGLLAKHNLASAMIDISDGLFQDLAHIATQSGVEIEIDLARVPASRAVSAGLLTLEEACTAGEDYELAWTAGIDKRGELEALPEISRIGTVCSPASGSPGVFIGTNGQRVVLEQWLGGDVGRAAGFDHFSSRK